MQDALLTLNAELHQVLTGLTPDQTQMTPSQNPAKWSIQQIVEHLHLTYNSTAEVLGKRLELQRPTRARVSLKQRAAQVLIIHLERFPRGLSAPDAVTPRSTSPEWSGDELAKRSRELLQELQELCDRGESLFGRSRAASHIVLGPLSMNDWRKFHRVHGRHHITQIESIRRSHRI